MRKIVLLLFSLLLFVEVFPQVADNKKPNFKSFATVGADFLIHNGKWGGTVPAIPMESSVSTAGTNYYGPGFGININYHFFKGLIFYFDINRYTRKTPVAYNGSYATSMWIFEQTGYTVNYVGPFSEDVFYDVNTTGFRFGLKASFNQEKTVQPWFGIYWGYYSVVHGIYNDNMTATYGNGGDYVSGVSFMNFGVDIWNKTRSFAVSFFLEMGAPVYSDYTIENCLINGWTFTDSDEGEHIFGTYRFGIALIANTSRK